jgi:hypothetical protein
VIEYAALCWDAFRREMAHHVDGALPPSRAIGELPDVIERHSILRA